jgi:hypothetical protein
MIDLQQDKLYTAKELSELFNCTRHTVSNNARKLFPDKQKKCFTSFYTYDESIAIFNNIELSLYPNIKEKMNNYSIIDIKGYEVLIDNDDLEYILSINWSSENAAGSNGIYFVCHKLKIKLHRQILKAKKGDTVDHINGNTLDNRKENLRICSTAENSRNSRRGKNNTSGYKGVCWDKENGKWYSSIMVDRKHINLGRYKTKREAYAAYCEAALKLHGEFARLA